MTNSELDRLINGMAEGLIRFIGKFLIAIWYGGKRLNKPKNLAVFLIGIVIAGVAWMKKGLVMEWLEAAGMGSWMRNMIYIVLLCSPVICLAIIGSAITIKQAEYFQKFKEIGFREKTGKYPLYLGEKEDRDKRVLYTFKSNISIGEWRKKILQLETALDCTILKLENKGSKRIIQMLAVGSEYKIPEKLVWNDDYMAAEDGVIVIGKGMLAPISFNLNRTPHVLAAGETGSGKSVILRCCLWQLVNQGAQVYMIDFKGGVEFGLDYEEYGEVITDRERAAEVLEMLCKENAARLALFRQTRAKNLPEYNRKTGRNLSRIGFFCDEIAEMLDKKGVPSKEREIYERLEGYISTLARLSRATGINLFLGVQRPDANVLTGQIKNNIPVRMCGRFADKAASEIVLNTTAATALPDIKGRFLYLMGNELLEFQAYYFDDETMLHPVEGRTKGEMLIENPASFYVQDGGRQGCTIVSQSQKPDPAVKEVSYEDYDFSFGEEEIEWSVDQ